MKKLLLSLPQELYEELVKVANEADRTVSAQIRTILKEYINENN